MLLVNYNVNSEIQVSLFTSAGVAITGAAYTAITCTFKKYGSSTWTTKTLNTSTWREVGSGLYYITFSDEDTNTYGNFYYRAVHTTGYFTGVAKITDYATEAVLLQNIYNILSEKVNTADILTRERELDNLVEFAQDTYDQLVDDISQLELQIRSLNNRIAAL